ncbi:MAG: 1-acyl-sn-glycerol-3-phosphate acyltransferase [Clostridia bacterium]|nr:1-acyl-sn-glycerol-3-phosphate acyltransferase [Clostridia bacterium]
MEKNRHLHGKWNAVCTLLSPFFRRIFRYSYEYCAPKGPCLVISNHVTNFDPILVGMAFRKKPLCFVASEHLFRKGWMTKALVWLFDPIARRKAASGMETAMACARRLKAGDSVCIFAEGETTWDGLTQKIMPATGNLARIPGVTLVTYRLEGGYLTAPRWANAMRKGRMYGRVVNTYTQEDLKGMTGNQITELIDRDIFENAWERQKASPVRYKGKNLAEGIEVALFMCPKCKRIGTVHGEGDHVKCDCGLNVRYTEYGTFEPAQPFENIHEWDKWQHEMLESGGFAREGSVLRDDNLVLTEVGAEHGEHTIAEGSLSFLPDRLSFAGCEFPFEEISSMALLQRRKLVFTHGGKYYEIRREKPLCMRKYLASWNFFRASAEKNK